MQKTNPAKSRSHQYSRRIMLLILSLAGALTTSRASAQMVVIDPGNISTNQSGFASQLAKTIDQYRQQIEQYAKQIQQYQLQVQQYQQMLSSIENIPNNLSLAPNRLQPVTDTQSLIQGRCSSASGSAGLVSVVMNSMSSLMTQSIAQTQQMLCGQIVATQVHKYNVTVDMLNKLNGYSDQFAQLDGLMNFGSTQADTDRASTQVQKYGVAIATDLGNWQARMNADSAVISTLENQQSILGHIALDGSNSHLEALRRLRRLPQPSTE